jgi:EmrB/QacA subfamily drug resistance transporter
VAQPGPKRWLALAVLLVATFMDLLDTNIVNVAIPSIQRDIGAPAAAVQGITVGYTLSFAVALITGGRLGDIRGRKRLFLIGIAGFVAASALCAAAQNSDMLAGARVLQGLAAALMVPQVLAMIYVMFSPQEIGRVIGLYASMIGVAIVAAPIAGGLLVSWSPFGLGWRSIFVVNLPIGVTALVAATRWMRESKSPRPLRLDLVGVLLEVTALLLLMVPLLLGREMHWPAWSVGCLVASVPAAAVFVFYEIGVTRRGGSPLVAPSLFRVRTFTVANAAQLLFTCVPAGFFLSWTLSLQVGLGWSALRTALSLIPFSMAVPLLGNLTVRILYPRYGRRALLAGVLVTVAGIVSYALLARRVGTGLTVWESLPSLLLIGAGMGMLLPPLTGLAIREVNPQDAGAASGVINSVGQLGAAVGVAVIGGIFFSALAGNAGAQADRVAPTVRAVSAQQGAALRTCAVDSLAQSDPSAVPSACLSMASGAGLQQRQALVAALAQIRARTFMDSFSETLLWSGVGLAAVFALLLLLPRSARRTAAVPEPLPAGSG